MNKFVRCLSSAMLLAGLVATPAHAILVSTDFSGTVTLDNGGTNPFGLMNGDSISGSAIYDDALIAGVSANEDHAINGLAGWSFSITLGSFTFTEVDVTDPTYTTFWFNMGAFDGIEFYIEPVNIGSISNLLVEDFDGGRSLFVEEFNVSNPVVYLEADWDFANASTPVAVSEPATLALLGLGLIGLGLSKKRKEK